VAPKSGLVKSRAARAQFDFVDVGDRGKLLYNTETSMHSCFSEIRTRLLLGIKAGSLDGISSKRQKTREILGKIFEEEILVLNSKYQL
jgi:hypothetical protein